VESNILKSERAESTIREYQRVVKRTQDEVLNNLRLPGQNVANPRTRSLERSAWRWCLINLLADDFRPREVHEICHDLLKKMRCASDLAVKNYNQRLKDGIQPQLKTKRKTKRSSLSGLDTNWRRQILDLAALRFPNELEALRVLSLTGARPVEIEKGVALLDFGKEVCFSIVGGKLGQWGHGYNGGQQSRHLTISKEHPNLADNVVNSSIVKLTRRRLEYVIKTLTQELWPKRKGQRAISPYTFRHAFSADLKAQNFTETDIAIALGHQSTISQMHYGSRAQGVWRGEACHLVELWAATEVRETAPEKKKKPPRKKLLRSDEPKKLCLADSKLK
jgi:integrase